MRRRLTFSLCIALVLGGLAGAATGLVELRRAVSRSRDLYRLDTVGSQVEGALEFNIQESRRAFLYALAVTDPNQQLPFVDAAREADRDVRGTIRSFRELNAPPDIAQCLGDFEKSWDRYARTRDAVMASILTGDSLQAMVVDQKEGNRNFAAALQNLGALKHALEAHAKSQSAQVDRTLKNCIAGLAFFVLGICCIMFVLVRLNRARAAAVQTLAAANRKLERTQELDRRRLAILEMVGTHAPLGTILSAIAELPGEYQTGAGAALWSAAGNKLLYQASAGLPEHITDVLRSQAFGRIEGHLSLDEEPRQEIAGLASRGGLTETIVPLLNVAGDAIGLLLMFAPRQAVMNAQFPAALMMQLASLAIENTSLYERLAFQAQHDVLTGLPNRLLFQDRVQQAILRAQRNRRKVALLWFDLDRFKQINDTLGHRVGDELLAECARRLKGSLRESDTAARIGGDEFVVLAADLESAADAQIIAAKIIKNIRITMNVSGHQINVSASAGISVYPEHGGDPPALMRSADLAMYQAKRFGRDTFQVFDKEIGDSLSRRLEIESELKHAIENGEFQMRYQPLIGRRNELDGFEALLRWNNHKLGRVSPAEFIPIAEESGLILQIGEWVTRTVCLTGARWLQAGIEVPRIAINASGLQFADPGFADKIRTALAESGFPAPKLELEVTETALVGNLETALKQIAELREIGVTFAIDDFGTGYSSLNQLRTLPVDCVKVDRSFVKDLERMTGDSTTLVRGIIGLAHNLRLTVVAEGVETERQLEILRSLGCDMIQGFFLHRPLTAEAAEDLMREHMARSQPGFKDYVELPDGARIPVSEPNLA
jgi:diguanylate cyclase (GGDEF)-like protein